MIIYNYLNPNIQMAKDSNNIPIKAKKRKAKPVKLVWDTDESWQDSDINSYNRLYCGYRGYNGKLAAAKHTLIVRLIGFLTRKIHIRTI